MLIVCQDYVPLCRTGHTEDRAHTQDRTHTQDTLRKHIAISFLRIQKYYIPNVKRLLLDMLPQTQTGLDFRHQHQLQQHLAMHVNLNWLQYITDRCSLIVKRRLFGRLYDRKVATKQGITMWMCIASILYTVAIYSQFYSCCGIASDNVAIFLVINLVTCIQQWVMCPHL